MDTATLSTRRSIISAGLSPYRETRGTLHYLVGTDERQQEGWFMVGMDGRAISCRKVRGRNRWHIANTEQVLLFRRHDA